MQKVTFIDNQIVITYGQQLGNKNYKTGGK
jgi:hypothetical protein